MNFITIPFVLLAISTTLIIFLAFYVIRKKPLIQIQKAFFCILLCVLIICIGVLLQSIFYNVFGFNPMYFEYIIYIGTAFLPVAIFFMALIFTNTKITFKRIYLLLFILPIVTLIILWTNRFHHLFYVQYSFNINESIVGPYFAVHSLYTYALFCVSMIMLIKNSFKTSGIFSNQSILFIVGTCIPIIVSLLGTTKTINMNVYLTPISFSLTSLFYALAIFKFNFLGAAPITLQKIVDRISDSYIVLNDEGNIIDYNQTFVTTFKLNKNKNNRGQNFETFLKDNNLYLNLKKIKDSVSKIINTDKTSSFELYIEKINKRFHIEINSIISNGNSLGILILFKDITQHMKDLQKIKDTQESLMESERLSSLGQLIGGIAHNLKTPIMSIAGAAEGLNDLIKEYDSSIDDPTVNSQDHHEIASDMSTWIEKIKNYTEYMSDIITAVKGQAVVMSNEDDINFTISELVKRVTILMKHELKNAIINLNTDIKVDENLTLNGDVNNLVQVINNMISNAIQAYNGKENESIEFTITKDSKNIIFSIEDHAGGLPDKVTDKLFKEMITTKGKNGTGLGLYMSYSTIKAHFNGNITFDTKKGKGTKFNIYIPM